MIRHKIKRFTKIRWDLRFRITFSRLSEDQQINQLAEIGKFMHKLAWTPVPLDFYDENREYYASGILEQIEKSIRDETTQNNP